MGGTRYQPELSWLVFLPLGTYMQGGRHLVSGGGYCRVAFSAGNFGRAEPLSLLVQ